MLIGILSDTHDNIPKTREAVAWLNDEGALLVLHAGDFISPFMIETLKDIRTEMVGVFGNNDGDRELLAKKCSNYPHLAIRRTFTRLTAGGMTIGLLHGSDEELLQTIIGCGAFDLVASGHTHRSEVSLYGRTLFVNPGEVCGYLTGKCTIAIVDTEKRHGKIIDF